MKFKKDIDILEVYLKEACEKISKNEFTIQSDIIIHNEETDEFFFPIKFYINKDGIYEKDKRLKLKNIIFEDENNKTLGFCELPYEEGYGKVVTYHNIGDKDLMFDCLDFNCGEIYNIYRYYNMEG